MGRLPLVFLLTANGISSIGNVVTAVAVPWFVLAIGAVLNPALREMDVSALRRESAEVV